MPEFRGVGPRIRERLLALGYVRADGEPDVRHFCLDHRYERTLFYDWLMDRRTPTKERERLCRDLGVDPAWLLFGVTVSTAPAMDAMSTPSSTWCWPRRIAPNE
jgi:hypothetical protein